MPLLPIYTFGTSVLRKKAKRVAGMDGNLPHFIDDMFETMYHAGGIGLAANQVGVLERVIVVDVSDMEEMKTAPEGTPGRTPLVLINPLVVTSEGSWNMEEGCLSIPEIREEVDRHEKIVVSFRDAQWNPQELEVSGILARVFLHEIDHLNGILFIDHLTATKQKLLRGRLNRIRRGEFEVTFPVVTEMKRES